MSKEKNLTFVPEGTSRPVVDASVHTWTKETKESYYHNEPCMITINHLFGPAIDRLHEFEKLGLEPEEIERKLKDYEEVSVAYKGCCNSVFELNEENWKLRDDLLNLQLTNKDLQEENSVLKGKNIGLKEEVEALRQKVANFEQSMKLLNDCINERDAEIEKLQKADPNPILAKERELVGAKCLSLERENGELAQANSRLFVKNMDLETKVWELNQIIKCHESTIKTLEDKLERIDCVLTEDDE